MRRQGLRRGLAIGVAILALAACSDDAGSTDAGPTTTTSAEDSTTTTEAAPVELTLTPTSLGPLRIRMTNDEAVATGLVDGDFEPGCELAGPTSQVASLAAPLDGNIASYGGAVTAITVRSSAVTVPGDIRVGDSLVRLEAADFGDGAVIDVNKGVEEMFGAWIVSVTDADQLALFSFLVDPATSAVVTMGAPHVPLCE